MNKEIVYDIYFKRKATNPFYNLRTVFKAGIGENA